MPRTVLDAWGIQPDDGGEKEPHTAVGGVLSNRSGPVLRIQVHSERPCPHRKTETGLRSRRVLMGFSLSFRQVAGVW